MPSTRDSAQVIRDIVSRMGGSIDKEFDGQVNFQLDDIAGYAHLKNETLRMSFFIAWDPEPSRAESFKIRLNVHGDIEVITLRKGTALRFLVTLPIDKIDAIGGNRRWSREVAAEARELRNDWEGIPQDRDLVKAFTPAGLTVPDLGDCSRDSVLTFGPWHWGCRYVDPLELYLFDPETVATEIAGHGHFFALAHAGHGLNSYGLSLVTGQGPLAIFVQHGYGGMMMEPISAQMDINATYARIATLFDATKDRADEAPRWLLYLSDFRGGCGILDLESRQTGAGESTGNLGSDRKFLTVAEFGGDEESRLFRKAAELLGDISPYNDIDNDSDND